MKRRVAFLGCSLLLLLLTWIVISATLGPSDRSSPAYDNHWGSSDPTIHAEEEWVVEEGSQSSSINGQILQIAGDQRELRLKSDEGVSVALFRDDGDDEPLLTKGYWDGILGIGNDRAGRINVDRIAAEEFPGLIASRHFTGGYLEGIRVRLRPECLILSGKSAFACPA